MAKIAVLCHRYRMLRTVCLILLLSACGVQGASVSEPGFTASARALDGDTIAADFRLLGVDAFEQRQLCQGAGSCWECGKAAQDLAARVLREADAQIRLSNRSSYGRPVATVTVGGRDLGETLIDAGLALPQPQFLKADPARAKRYAEAFAAAQRNRAGAFSGRWIEPARWRLDDRLTCER